MPTIRKIKADAQVSVVFGTPFISRLQQLMIFVAQELSDEQLKTLRDQMQEKVTEFDEPIMQHSATLFMLLADIENKVVAENLYVDEEAEELTPPEN